MNPRLGERVLSSQKYTPRPGVYAFLPRGNKVLLTRQLCEIPEIQLPGGGIDPGEAILPALHREVMEETGWSITRARRLGLYRRFVYMPEYDLWAEKICHIYTAAPVNKVADPADSEHEVVWADRSVAVSVLTSQADQAFLSSVL